MKLVQKIRTLLLVSLLKLSTAAIAANPVVELQANEVSAYTAKHRHAVVQFTSTDPKCGYCVGADKAFDTVASKAYSQPVAFARVVWPAPWSKLPQFPAEFGVLGAPWHLTFRSGKSAGGLDGMPKDPQEMVQAVESFVTRPVNAQGAVVIASTPGVKDVAAQDLRQFVKSNSKVVVQFISSDLLCTFCNGAELAFNELASKNTDKGIVFARVQWAFPWRKLPDMGTLTTIVGLPMQVAFANEKNIGSFDGKYTDKTVLGKEIKALFAANQPQVASIAESQTSKEIIEKLGSDELSQLRLHLRHEFFQKVGGYCSKQFPGQATENSNALAAWKASNQNKLDAAAALMLKRASQGGDIDFAELTSLEKTQAKVWQVSKLGIPDNRAPQADDCMKMMRNLAKFD